MKLNFLFILLAASGIATANATALSSPNEPAPVISSANDTAGQSAAQDSPSAPSAPQQPKQPPQFPPNYKPAAPVRYLASPGSTYIPLDSWIYPAVLRLYSLGYMDSVFLGLRPWTRLNVEHMLERTADRVNDSDDEEARGIYLALLKELQPDAYARAGDTYGGVELETVYSRFLGISGTSLHDSYHVGETITNDYGRPYEEGFNNSTGFSARGESGRFSLYFRGEYQHAPSGTGYSPAVVQILATQDNQGGLAGPNPTIPSGFIDAENPFRILEANLSYHLVEHEISFGKSDAWLGPGVGASMAWSNNAEDIYSFRINRVEPLTIPLVSRILGPVRYDFFVGSLKGHTIPNDPWVHAEKFSFKPTANFEFGFERTVVWGGKGHEPITLHTFLKSFFSFSDTSQGVKLSRSDPGARFSAFDFSYRLPFVRNWLTFYTDSEVHDDVTPISAPRRSALHPGLYLSHFPSLPKLDLRVEADMTDPRVAVSRNGSFMYWEVIQKQAYTNKGQLMGDWIGREGKGGQAWLTYHLSPNESVQASYRTAKAAKDFIPGGTTQNDFSVDVVKRLTKDLEIHGWVQHERWFVPLLKPGAQSDTSTAVQVTFYPHKRADY